MLYPITSGGCEVTLYPIFFLHSFILPAPYFYLFILLFWKKMWRDVKSQKSGEKKIARLARGTILHPFDKFLNTPLPITDLFPHALGQLFMSLGLFVSYLSLSPSHDIQRHLQDFFQPRHQSKTIHFEIRHLSTCSIRSKEYFMLLLWQWKRMRIMHFNLSFCR